MRERACLTTLAISAAVTILTAAQPKTDTARTWLQRSAAALGGESTLRALRAVEINGLALWQQREQSERPEGPWVQTFDDFADVRHFAAGAIRRTTRTRGYATPDWVDTADWLPSTTTLVVDGVGLRRSDGSLRPVDTPGDLGALPLELGPERVVITALDASDARAEGQVTLHGYAHDVVAFTDRGARVRVLLNPPSMLPKAVEITRPRPYDMYWAPWGDVTTRVTFGQWTLQPEGVRYPRLWEYATGGSLDGTVTITRVDLAPAATSDEFAIPADVRQRFIVNRQRVDEMPFGRSSRQTAELAPGIVKVPASFDVLEIRQPDGIVIVEGPSTSAYSVKAIDDARARFGSATVKAVITTSDAWPHIGGLREYVARGIPIYALDLNAPILKRLFAARYDTFPDALARTPKAATLRLVSAKTIVGSGDNRIELYPLRTVTGERQMMAYFPAHRLLYTSDLFTLLPDGQVFLPQQMDEAIEAAAREHLDVDRAFGMHYDAVPWTTITRRSLINRPPALP
jgi:hypothetical protein